MPDGNWFSRHKTDLAKWAFCAFAAAAVLGVIGYGLVQQAAYSQSAADRSADYSEYAATQIDQACTGIAKLEKPVCVKKAATEYHLQARDKQREYDDLAAQQTSALWTSVMGIAALIGMGLSAVGVALVYTTFRETRRSADAASDSYAALIAFESAIIDVQVRSAFFYIENNVEMVKFTLSVLNVGRSPAYVQQINIQNCPELTYMSILKSGGKWDCFEDFRIAVNGGEMCYGTAIYSTGNVSNIKRIFGLAVNDPESKSRSLDIRPLWVIRPGEDGYYDPFETEE